MFFSKLLKKVGFLAAVSVLVANANAASIRFAETVLNVDPGETFTIDLLGDFAGDPTLGGGIDIFFDETIIKFDSFSFDRATIGLDLNFSRSPDLLDGELEGLTLGNFNGIGDAGIIGTLSFQALIPGQTFLEIAVTDKAQKGGDFISGEDFSSRQQVEFTGLAVNVNAIPIPAAAWLMGSALIGLLGARKRLQSLRK